MVEVRRCLAVMEQPFALQDIAIHRGRVLVLLCLEVPRAQGTADGLELDLAFAARLQELAGLAAINIILVDAKAIDAVLGGDRRNVVHSHLGAFP